MANEMIVIFHHDERGAVRTWSEIGRLVRCKDCKYGWYDIADRGMYCGRKHVILDTDENDYCSYGERKK